MCLGGASFASPPVVHKTWVALVALAEPALRAEVCGGIIFVTSGENAWHLIKMPSGPG